MYNFSVSRIFYDDPEDNVDIVSSPCPKCDAQYGLVIMSNKKSRVVSQMKITCLACKFKFTGVYKNDYNE